MAAQLVSPKTGPYFSIRACPTTLGGLAKASCRVTEGEWVYRHGYSRAPFPSVHTYNNNRPAADMRQMDVICEGCGRAG